MAYCEGGYLLRRERLTVSINTNAWNRIRYNLYAPFYDIAGRLFNADRKRSIQMLQLRPDEKVLLLGAGTGIDLEFLPREADVTAVDISPAMIKQVQKRAERIDHDVNALVMDGHALDFPDETFDVVILHLILAVIPDPHACISEAVRVLKPDGRMSIFDKFLPEGTDLSLGRKMGNVVTSFFFSEINRQLKPIVASTSLRSVQEEAANFENLGYQITILHKSERDV